MKTRVLILAGFIVLQFTANHAEATTITWTNTAGGNWADAANWNPNQIPGASDDVVITAAGSYTVTVHQAVSINSLAHGGVGASPILRLEGNGPYHATLTVANGFTNNAVIELTNMTANRSATLTVNGGPLVNDTGGDILVSAGAGGGNRTLAAELDNRGTITAGYPLTVNKTGAAHANSGSIASSADIILTLNSASFENSGSMTLSGGAMFDINGNGEAHATFTTTGTLDLGTGILDAYYCTFDYGAAITGASTQEYSYVILNLTPDLSNAGAAVLLKNSITVNGPGTLINATGQSMLLSEVTCNADLVNQGDLLCRRTVNINGGFDNTSGSLITVEGYSSYQGHLTLANSFTNNAVIELTNMTANRHATLTVNGGPLVNDTGGVILVSAGAGGGNRTLAAELDNRGTITADHPLTVNKTGAAHANSGSIASSADIILTLSSASFDNSGSMTFSGGAMLDINGNGIAHATFTTTGTLDLGTGILDVYYCTFNYGAAITGTSTQEYGYVTLNLTPDLSNVGTAVLLKNNITVNGPGTLINATGRSMLLDDVTCNADLVNNGDLLCRRTVNINGGFDNTSGSLITVEGYSSYQGHLILANSFTNNSVIELTNMTANRHATLTVNGGPLVNDTGGVILVSAGAGGGNRTLAAELDNRGTITADHLLTVNKNGAAHANSGSIASSADIILTLSSASFDNSGSMTLSGGAMLDINGNGTVHATFTTSGILDLGTGILDAYYCTFNYGAAITGTSTQEYGYVTLNLTPDLSNAGTAVLLNNNITVNGPGTLINATGKSMLLSEVTCNADLVNQGDLLCRRTVNINGDFDNTSGSLIKVEGYGSYNGYLILANSFTNNAVIELTNVTVNRSATFTANGGPLVNDTGGVILVSAGAGGGSRTLAAELDNRGAITAGYPFTVNKTGAAHANSGSIASSADIILSLSSASFDSSGSMILSGGAMLDINGNGIAHATFTTSGTLDLGTGILDAYYCTFNYGAAITGTSTQEYNYVTLNLTPDLSNAGTAVLLKNNITVNGPGTLINATGQSMLLDEVTCNADLVNQGDLLCRRTVNINGDFDNTSGSLIKVEGYGSYNGYLILANSFTNNAVIELTNVTVNRSATFTANGGPLVNDAGGVILVSAGAGGGSRTLAAELDNRGTITAGYPFTVNKTGAAHANSGSIASSADIILTLNSASFDNSGSMTLSGGAMLDINGNGAAHATFTTSGTLDLGTGILDAYYCTFNYLSAVTGSSTQEYNFVTLNLTPDLSNATSEILLKNSTVNGPGRLINAAGRDVLFEEVTCNADLENQGNLICRRNVKINGDFETTASSSVKVEGAGSYNAYLTLADSYTNNALMELTSLHASRFARIIVNGGGLLMNDSGGVILSSTGAGGSIHTLYAELDNRGTITVDHAFTIQKSGAQQVNSGTIELADGNLSFAQANTTASFSNSGVIDIGETRTMTVDNGSFSNLVSGTIQGKGTLDLAGTTSDLVNYGAVAPGTSIGQLSLTGDYNPESDGVLAVEIGGHTAGSEYDQFAVSGAASLNGVLDAELVNGFEPTQYDSFTVASFASRSGTFSTTNLPSTHLYGWEVEYTNTNVKLTVINTAPKFDPVADQEVDELIELTVDASATDTDLPAQTLTYSLLDEPSGASIDPGSGLFSWTPSESQGPGTNTIAVRVVDDGTPNLSATNEFEVVVNEVNVAPSFHETPTNRIMDELTLLTVTNAAGDVDIPANTLTFTLLTPPTGAEINPTNGIITWIPAEDQGPGTNTLISVVTDDGDPVLSATNEFQVFVEEVNEAPVFDDTPDDVTVDELTLLTVTNAAGDVDIPVNELLYTLMNGPAGAAINPTNGIITWTPAEDQGPGTNIITSVVTDDGVPILSATNSFEVIVNEVNEAPVFDATPDDVVMDELTLLAVTNGAGDVDIPANMLTYTLLTPPAGAEINPTNGIITWMPAEDQGPGTNTITSVVTDDGIPILSVTNAFQVVVNEINTAPVFLGTPTNETMDELTLLTVTNAAGDADLPVNGLTFGLLDAPAGAGINPTNGIITWTPTEDQGPGTHNITSVVIDNGVPILSATNSFEVIVNEVNSAPVFDATPDDVVMDELTLLAVTNGAGDVDIPINELLYTLMNGPAGAAINPTNGIITWTPAEDQGPGTNIITSVVTDDGVPILSATNSFEVIVNEVNEAPVFDATPDDVVMDELTLLAVTNGAGDVDIPANTLTYTLLAPPAGAEINPANGIITWTPAENQGPGTNTITSVVTDDGDPVLSATNSFLVFVEEVDEAPVFDDTPDDVTMDELTLLVVTNSAVDADIPDTGLAYGLLAAPAGAVINPANGIITWTPSEEQGPSTNTVTTIVTDGGVPALSMTNSFQIMVNEVNTAPVMNAVADATIHAEAPFAVTLTASDSDIPTNTLSFSLVSGPAGAQVDAGSGLFTWTPGAGDAGSTHPVSVKVEDSGSPMLSDAQAFSLTVVDPLAFTAIETYATGSVEVIWNAISGQTYRVLYTDDLVEGSWSNLVPDVVAGDSSASQVDAAASNAVTRFYDVFQVE